MKTGIIGLWGDYVQIIRLKIDNNKCLDDFNIRFEIDKEHGSSTVLIGENGTGKSSMLQAVLTIMMSFDSEAVEKTITYPYSIKYFYKGSIITLNRSGKNYTVSIDDKPFCKGSLKTVKAILRARNKSIFPERVNYFYSGLNNQIRRSFQLVDTKYVKKCRDATVRYWNALYLTNRTYTEAFPKRRYNYCSEELIPLYLIAIICGNDSSDKQTLSDQCNITKIETVSIDISVKELRERLANDIVEIGKEGICDLVDFIDYRFTEHFRQGLLFQEGIRFVFELHNIGAIDADTVAFFSFFEKLSTILSVKYSVTVKVGDTPVNCADLSEGQRQLIKIIGMLSICKNEDTLVLMDEPDAHMNPKWKYELKSTIDRCLENSVNTQAIIATHDPLVINGVDKSFIRVFTSTLRLVDNTNKYSTRVIEPTEDTEGLGIDGLLQSEYYGLRTSYDKKATDKFIRRQELYSKLINGDADEEEKEELRTLTKEIGSLPMSYNSIDFLYDDFISVYKNTDLFAKQYLSFDEIQKRRKKIEEILNALYEGQV